MQDAFGEAIPEEKFEFAKQHDTLQSLRASIEKNLFE
jgi:hypothetical protein